MLRKDFFKSNHVYKTCTYVCSIILISLINFEIVSYAFENVCLCRHDGDCKEHSMYIGRYQYLYA